MLAVMPAATALGMLNGQEKRCFFCGANVVMKKSPRTTIKLCMKWILPNGEGRLLEQQIRALGRIPQ